MSKPLVGGLCVIVSNDPTEVEYAEAERAHADEKIIGEMNWGAIRALRQTADVMDRQPRFITTVEEAIEFVRGVANNLERGI